jgi:hypothetical protein
MTYRDFVSQFIGQRGNFDAGSQSPCVSLRLGVQDSSWTLIDVGDDYVVIESSTGVKRAYSLAVFSIQA